MELTTIGFAIASVLFVLALYVIYKQDEKIRQANSKIKSLENDIREKEETIQWLKSLSK